MPECALCSPVGAEKLSVCPLLSLVVFKLLGDLLSVSLPLILWKINLPKSKVKITVLKL
jgi:hypothetical protein